jgi:hypothetical protein
MGEKWPVNLACNSDSHVNHRVLLHATNLQHGTDGFTSPPKEDMLWIFSPEKSNRPGLNPRSWVPEASMLTTRPPKLLCHTAEDRITFTAKIDHSRFNNSCLRLPASTLVDLIFQSCSFGLGGKLVQQLQYIQLTLSL